VRSCHSGGEPHEPESAVVLPAPEAAPDAPAPRYEASGSGVRSSTTTITPPATASSAPA
jgi:hypothetical protein